MRVSLFAPVVMLSLLAGIAAAEKTSEEQKIESLIASIEGLTDAKFIRNGKEYDCKEAADHMRRKWDSAKDQIKTARDFITGIASKSQVSGKEYRIRFKDGKEQTSGAFLTAKLDEIEGKQSR